MQWLLLVLILFLGACSGQEINYLHTNCDPLPQVNILKRPPHPEPFEQGKACFVYLPLAEDSGRERTWAGTVYAALEKEYLFRRLLWGGRLRYETLFQECAGADYLVTLEALYLEAASKVAPARLALSLSVKRLRDENTIWHLTGSLELCPRYPRDYVIHLTSNQPPYAQIDHLSSELFFLVRYLCSFLRG